MDDNDPQHVSPSSKVDAQTSLKTPTSSRASSSGSALKNDYENISATKIEHQNNLSSIYNGPIIGKARALVDYTPSPYDRDALRFKVSLKFTTLPWIIIRKYNLNSYFQMFINNIYHIWLAW